MSESNQDTIKKRSLLDLLRVPPKKYYLFPPGWKVPKWIEDIRPKGIARFVSLTFVIRRSDMVYVYPIGINTGILIRGPVPMHIIGGPTCLCVDYMISLDSEGPVAIRIYPDEPV